MKHEASIHINAPAETVFAIYRNVADWSQWDSEIQIATLNGAFQDGSTGILKPTSGNEETFTLMDVVAPHRFSIAIKLPLCTMRFAHELIPQNEQTLVINRIHFTGLFAPLWRRFIGKSIHAGMPNTLAGLKCAAEQGYTQAT